ncbi:MAG: hypothetical protein K6B28_08940 [Lachnospiraceae bacterium]|nr:hypothetical protein [Lachnospiraceae bacterium]
MARTVDIDVKLERQEKKILKLRMQLDEAQDEYDKLMEEKKEADKQKILVAYSKSKRSLDEVIDFLKGKADI